MLQISRIKYSLLLFAAIQIGWSMFGYQVFQTQNVFPLYTWQIFHTEPTRVHTQNTLVIHKLDGREFHPPADILSIPEEFPNIEMYTLTQKILRANSSDAYPLLESELLRGHQYVKWEVKKLTFDAIEFFSHQTTLKEKSFGINESTQASRSGDQ